MKPASRSKRAPVLKHGRRTVIDYDSPMVRRILDAAEQVFARMSFPGTAMEDIAALAGCNKATIYYHIGGKEKLYQEILKRHFGQFAERLESALHDTADPVKGLLESVRIHARLFEENERSTRTIAHELAFGSPHVTPEIAAIFDRILATTARMIERGTAAGKFKGLDPSIVHIVLVSPLLIGAIASQFFAKVRAASGVKSAAKPRSSVEIGQFLGRVLAKGLTSG